MMRPCLHNLIAWLETQPEQPYNFMEARECLVAQFLKHAGVLRYNLMNGEIDSIFGNGFRLAVLQGMPRTYSAALQRARQFEASQLEQAA